jgi:hypothetical protein
VDVLEAMGEAYQNMLADRNRLRAQMQAYAACDDPDICEVVRNGYGDNRLVRRTLSGLPPQEVTGSSPPGC